MTEILYREFVYIWYYFDIQLRQIIKYWIIGILIGSAISVFAKSKIHSIFANLKTSKWGTFGIVPASFLGILSPLCMYGTIPIAASFYKQGMRQDWLAAFMMSSILLNPQLIIYSMALGNTILVIRIISCFLCGILAGILLHVFYKNKNFFNFNNFDKMTNRDTDHNLLIRYIKNIYRNLKATGLYFLFGILLSALFQRYIPTDLFADLFGKQRQLGVFLAATIGVPLYVCGGGTIPLLLEWINSGMSIGAATSFMLTGPSTKITNLSALKIVLGKKNFIIYFIYVFTFSFLYGSVINLFF